MNDKNTDKAFVGWEKSKKGYEAWHYEFNCKRLDVWKIASSDNLSIWNDYKWTVQLNGGEYLRTGMESTLDKACESAMKEATI